MRSLNSKKSLPLPITTGLVILLSISGGWLSSTLITAPAVYAAPTKVDITLDVLAGETFELLLRRAEAVARAATQRSFDRDILVNEVNVLITAQYNGNIAPILSLQVTRENWRTRPDPKVWSIYYRASKTLLKLNAPATAPTLAPPPPAVPSLPSPAEILENESP